MTGGEGGGLSFPWWRRCERRNPRAPSFEERGERGILLELRKHFGLERGIIVAFVHK
jgi:hypothetical protein